MADKNFQTIQTIREFGVLRWTLNFQTGLAEWHGRDTPSKTVLDGMQKKGWRVQQAGMN